MTDHKFTDDDVIKALELCSKLDLSFEECNKCPYKGECGTKDGNMPADALALINRQKCEIERLEKSLADQFNSYENIRKKAKSEAIKEFAERVKSDLGRIPQYHFTRSEVEWSINSLVKEMTEGTK